MDSQCTAARGAIAVLAFWCVVVAGCDSSTSETPVAARPTEAKTVLFVDRAEALGLRFDHFSGMWGARYILEMVGGGVALFDYDRDGDLDVYLVQGAMIDEGKTLADATYPPDEPPRDRLFRNELAESGDLRFTDVTDAAGIDLTGYGLGVAVGDIDGDGWLDLYVTHWGPNVMLRNNRDGTFSDVTAASGTGDDRWGTSAVFVDYDADGRPDLFVANYVRFSPSSHKPCYAAWSAIDYCGPDAYDPLPDRLFRNLGDGRFEDVTAASQIARHYGAGLGVVASDLNRDGYLDLYVANDGNPNQLWINQGDGTFRDDSLLAGCAVNRDGQSEASMGVEAADFDGDGDEDLFMTHLVNETNTLYLNDGTGVFDDASDESGMSTPSRAFTGFGTNGLDVENRGWLDVLVVNGEVRSIREQEEAGDPLPLRQANQLLRNVGAGRFEEVSDRAGPEFEREEVSRGSAAGDIDNDGDLDVVICNNSGPVRLLINQVGQDRHWIGMRVLSSPEGLETVGARVEVVHTDRTSAWRRVRRTVSYLSASDPRVTVGLGDRTSIAAVRVHWPDGGGEEWTDLAIDRYHTLVRGTGRALGG